MKEAAAKRMRELNLPVIRYPVAVHLTIMDQIHSKTPDWQRELMKHRLLFESTGGDLDNKEKAILDALNQVVYQDDRQVVQVYKLRTYAEQAGFKLTITPVGLAKTDLLTIEKLIKLGLENGQKKNGRPG